jgi:hypothetical protein
MATGLAKDPEEDKICYRRLTHLLTKQKRRTADYLEDLKNLGLKDLSNRKYSINKLSLY